MNADSGRLADALLGIVGVLVFAAWRCAVALVASWRSTTSPTYWTRFSAAITNISGRTSAVSSHRLTVSLPCFIRHKAPFVVVGQFLSGTSEHKKPFSAICSPVVRVSTGHITSVVNVVILSVCTILLLYKIPLLQVHVCNIYYLCALSNFSHQQVIE